MKKLLAALVGVLVLFGGFMTWQQLKNNDAPIGSNPDALVDVPAAENAEEGVPTVEEAPRGLDYDAIRALHDADETVIRLADEELSWSEYSEWLCMTGRQIEDFFNQMYLYYGLAADWTGSVGDETGRTYAQYAVSDTNNYLTRILAIRAMADEMGLALDEGDLAALDPEQLAAELFGEGATVDDLAAVLEQENHMTVSAYRSMSAANILYSKIAEALYGENGAKVDEADAVAWMEEQGYVSAGHILFMTIDPDTGDALDAAVIAEKKATADAIYAELSAIEDREELLRRFAELKAQYCEDGGKLVYPDGYTYTPGTMVAEFEDTVNALDEYAVAEPVQTAYGYHVILRLPLRGDSLLYSAQGTPYTAREQLASAGAAEALTAFEAEHPAEFADGLEELDLTPFILG
ncbi:MAG: peptidylprolyl isomerase [Oscillospiraceae bacterium]|nr:peptidylprolyl isomerase [Oscillospiraceae bacterium]